MTQHHSPIGVLVGQLGTPDAPTPQALRRYLKQFLSDSRVIDYNPLLWQVILRGIILNTRPRKSAQLYQRIWLEEGSPLLVYSQRQAEGLQQRLGAGYRVVLGMTYGEPSIKRALAALEAEGIDRILVFSMFPQYSSTTTASIYDAVNRAAAGRRCPLFLERKRTYPTLRFVPPYYDHPGFIAALKARVEAQIAANGQPDQLLISFHGIPDRYVQEGDPYREQCVVTARLLADSLGLGDDQWRIGFQSRFGPEAWLEPYTEAVIEESGRQGMGQLMVTCPAFTVDCLETLDEIGNEGRELFDEHGGGELSLVPCVNDHPSWLDTMAEIVRQETQGWAG